MEKRTESFLQGVGDKVFRETIKPSIVKEDTFADQRESTERFLRDPRLNREQREQVKKMLDNEKLYQVTERIDPRAEKEAEARAEALIKDAIKKGKIPPPKMDGFMRRMQERAGDPRVKKEYYEKHNADMARRFKKK